MIPTNALNKKKPLLDAPSFTKEPSDVSTDPGKTVKLECEADGNPDPTYAWFLNGDENKMLDDSATLSLVLGDSTIGSYTCRVTVKGYKEIRSVAKEEKAMGFSRIQNIANTLLIAGSLNLKIH